MAKKSTTSGVDMTTGKIGSYKMDVSAFDNLTGEKLLGLNIIELKVGEAAGPFRLVNILKDQNLAKKQKLKKGEKPKLIDIYVGENGGNQVRMPASASFILKAQESKLSIGDIFAVKRLPDYPNPNGGMPGKDWHLVITERAKK